MERNWIIAYPLIRGGSDLGINWHRQALKENKFISVLDIIGSFEFLNNSGLSHPSLICASSTSAGAGLLASAINT